MGLYFSFSRYIILVLILSAAILAMQPYQISADIEVRKLATKPFPSPPPPMANLGKSPKLPSPVPRVKGAPKPRKPPGSPVA